MSSKKRKSQVSLFWEIVIISVLILLAITILYPFWNILVLSFSTPHFSETMGIKLWPQPVTFNNFKLLFSSSTIAIAYQNTVVRTILATFLNVIFTMGLAYGLSKKKLMFNKLISVLVLITLMFGGGLIPTFFLVRSLGIYDTFAALILPYLMNAFTLFIARNFIISLPESLEEAAYIDGANHIYIFVSIILPLSLPIVATLALYAAVGNWNAWFDSLVFTKGRHLMTLQLHLRNMLRTMTELEMSLPVSGSGDTLMSRESYKASTIIITILPIIMVYPFAQKYFLKGILIGAVKG